MKEGNEEEILKIYGAKGTKQVLEYLDKHDGAPYREMGEFMNVGTLNFRLQELMSLGLIRHCLKKKPKRIEWYEITEKGKKVLQQLRVLLELTADSS